MAHGINTSLKRGASGLVCKNEGKAGIGSRRIFAPQFKLQVLDSYRNDVDCKGNQRATARKYGIHRRQIQKWLQVENNLRNSVIKSNKEVSVANNNNSGPEARKCGIELALRNCDQHRQRDDMRTEAPVAATYAQTPRQHQNNHHSHHHNHHHQHQGQGQAQGQRELCCGAVSPLREQPPPSQLDIRVPDAGAHHAHLAPSGVPALPEHHLDRRVPEITYLAPDHQYLGALSTKSEPISPVCSPIYVPVTASPELSLYKCDCPETPLPLPLDFTVRRCDAGSPIDLSVKRCPRNESPFTPVAAAAATAPSPAIQADHLSPRPRPATPQPPATRPPPCRSPDPQIWDLSTKGTKRPLGDREYAPASLHHAEHGSRLSPIGRSLSPCNDVNSVTSSVDVKMEIEPKPVKLFKPYLLDDENSSNSNSNSDNNKCTDRLCNQQSSDLGYSSNTEYFYNNNNEYYYKDTEAYKNYYYQINQDYFNTNNFNTYINDNDKNDFYKKNCNNVVKQRQSYSLDFKLSAIQCYYSDEVCKGNQRAVATKYNIHRRQVQKWLKQEDELRQRIESTKHMHIVT